PMCPRRRPPPHGQDRPAAVVDANQLGAISATSSEPSSVAPPRIAEEGDHALAVGPVARPRGWHRAHAGAWWRGRAGLSEKQNLSPPPNPPPYCPHLTGARCITEHRGGGSGRDGPPFLSSHPGSQPRWGSLPK